MGSIDRLIIGITTTLLTNQNFIDYVIIGVENKKQLFENINRSKDIALKNSDLIISEHILMPSNWPTT